MIDLYSGQRVIVTRSAGCSRRSAKVRRDHRSILARAIDSSPSFEISPNRSHARDDRLRRSRRKADFNVRKSGAILMYLAEKDRSS